MIDVYIVGSKGIPAKYGGFETFVEELTKGKKNQDIKYHVSCMDNEEKRFEYNDSDCFNVKVPMRGAIGRIFHVSRALKKIEKIYNSSNDNIVYVLGCRIGPLMHKHYKQLKKLGFKVFVNPDGLEWKRDKWNKIEKKILKYCEKCLVKNSDLVICDSKSIEKYVLEEYGRKVRNTIYISYGAYVQQSKCEEIVLNKWLKEKNISDNGYYLIVGRFVPENNYETMIMEFMKSKTNKDLVIITNVEKNKFYDSLSKKTGFISDSRIKFVGTVYDKELLKKIRENAFAYIHGHEVGGTNPSLLEALGSTKLNLLLDVCFNREVGADSAFYWNKSDKNLSSLIDEIDLLSDVKIKEMSEAAKLRVVSSYNWEDICSQYENCFIKNK